MGDVEFLALPENVSVLRRHDNPEEVNDGHNDKHDNRHNHNHLSMMAPSIHAAPDDPQ